jgi:hypothetical protein
MFGYAVIEAANTLPLRRNALSGNTTLNHKSVLSVFFIAFLSIGSLLAMAWGLPCPEVSHADAPSVQNVGQWTVVSSPVPVTYSLNSVAAVSRSDAWAVGYKGYAANGVSYGPLIVHWNGSAWSEVLLSSTVTGYYNLESVTMLSANDVWSVGGGDWWGDSFGAILHWDGNTWKKTGGGTNYLKSVAAVSGDNVWAAGVYKVKNLPSGTTFGSATTHWNGSTWEGLVHIGWYGLNSVAMVSSNNGWAVGRMILRWNGSAWNSVNPFVTQLLRSVTMISANEGWAVGDSGTILHWDGSTWSQASSPVSQTLNSVTMVSADEGWAVGDSGTIVHWDGDTWSQVSSPVTQTLKSVTMISANEGWAVGEKGTILHYTNVKKLYLPLVVRQ